MDMREIITITTLSIFIFLELFFLIFSVIYNKENSFSKAYLKKIKSFFENEGSWLYDDYYLGYRKFLFLNNNLFNTMLVVSTVLNSIIGIISFVFINIALAWTFISLSILSTIFLIFSKVVILAMYNYSTKNKEFKISNEKIKEIINFLQKLSYDPRINKAILYMNDDFVNRNNFQKRIIFGKFLYEALSIEKINIQNIISILNKN